MQTRLKLTSDKTSWYATKMATDLDSFEKFVREQVAAGRQCTPEELVHLWREQEQSANGGSSDESLYDRLSRKALLGFVQGGPDDLSSNPKHMEGFGQS